MTVLIILGYNVYRQFLTPVGYHMYGRIKVKMLIIKLYYKTKFTGPIYSTMV